MEYYRLYPINLINMNKKSINVYDKFEKSIFHETFRKNTNKITLECGVLFPVLKILTITFIFIRVGNLFFF